MTALLPIYQTLLAHYGPLHWWPARTPFEVMVGAVLTQNTAWSNVEKAIANFGDDVTPQVITEASDTDLAAIIRPAGYFNQKATYLKAVTAWYATYGYDVATIQTQPLPRLRAELLATRGVGPETADSILLYAFDLPTFVIDAYTNRLCQRYPINAGKRYSQVKAYFEANLPHDVALYNEFHAQIVINAKQHCRKQPLCDGCPLVSTCARQGVELSPVRPLEPNTPAPVASLTSARV